MIITLWCIDHWSRLAVYSIRCFDTIGCVIY